MGLITHPCTRCGHPDYWRRVTGPAAAEVCGTLDCRCRCCTPGPPEIRPTWDLAAALDDRLIEPGEKVGGPSGAWTCGCDDCKTLYQQQAQGAG